MSELLPCPFCGNNEPDVYVVGVLETFSVQCDCGIESAWFDTRADAIAAWNHRATPGVPDDANYKLEWNTTGKLEDSTLTLTVRLVPHPAESISTLPFPSDASEEDA